MMHEVTKNERIALVGDLHLGPRCETAGIRDKVIAGQKAFLDDMVAKLSVRGIDTIVFLGDIFTTRTTLGVDTIDYALDFFGMLHSKGFTSHIICGNHDLMYDDVDTVSSLRLLENIRGVHVYKGETAKLRMLGKTWYMVPWITPGRMPSVVEWLGKLASSGTREDTVIAGHFDMCGMLMEAGQVSDTGLEPAMFAKAAANVFSGHYHCRSEKVMGGSRIAYLGSPYHLSFAHVGTDCGFYVLDGDMNLEFVENTISPRFTECDDEHLDALPDLSNMFVRYFALTTRNFDDALARKKVLVQAHPLHIKPIPYGGSSGSIADVKLADDTETRKLMGADSISVAEMYMDRYPDFLPKFSDGCDPKEKIVTLLRGMSAKAK